METMHFKFFDDLTLTESINLKDTLTIDHSTKSFPVNFHDRTGHKLIPGASKIQSKLNQIADYAEETGMAINYEKSKVMIFNRSRIYDFMPNLKISNNELEVVEEAKLLGVIIRSDLKWNSHVKYICKKSYISLWMVRRLKNFGASTSLLLDMYNKHVRSLVEYAVPAWGIQMNWKVFKNVPYQLFLVKDPISRN